MQPFRFNNCFLHGTKIGAIGKSRDIRVEEKGSFYLDSPQLFMGCYFTPNFIHNLDQLSFRIAHMIPVRVLIFPTAGLFIFIDCSATRPVPEVDDLVLLQSRAQSLSRFKVSGWLSQRPSADRGAGETLGSRLVLLLLQPRTQCPLSSSRT